jgi:hypothetical protein
MILFLLFIEARGGDPCSSTVPCDATRGLTCSNTSNTCQCNQLSYWDNVTTFWCQTKVILINFILFYINIFSFLFFFVLENLWYYLSIFFSM